MATQFTLYPLLSAEIQIKIWKFSLRQPRMIELGAVPEELLYRGRVVEDVEFWERIKITTISSRSTLIPAALETCFLSREVALKFYNDSEIRRCFFNPTVDTLFFGREFDFISGWDHWERVSRYRQVRDVAFDLDNFLHRQDFQSMAKVERAQYPHGITFVVQGPFGSSGQDLALALAPRFKSIQHHDIASDKSLRSAGTKFKQAQSRVFDKAWQLDDLYFRTYGKHANSHLKDGRWEMPKVKFLLQDEEQAGKAREERRVRQELADMKRAEDAAAAMRLAMEAPVDWNYLPPRDEICLCPQCRWHLSRG